MSAPKDDETPTRRGGVSGWTNFFNKTSEASKQNQPIRSYLRHEGNTNDDAETILEVKLSPFLRIWNKSTIPYANGSYQTKPIAKTDFLVETLSSCRE